MRLVVRCRALTPDRVKPGAVSQPDPTIRILGPTFSGSSETLTRALLQVQPRLPTPYTVRVLSGSATDSRNKETIESASGSLLKATFKATVHPDDVLLPKMVNELGWVGWSRRMAVLFEANTQYRAADRECLLAIPVWRGREAGPHQPAFPHEHLATAHDGADDGHGRDGSAWPSVAVPASGDGGERESRRPASRSSIRRRRPPTWSWPSPPCSGPSQREDVKTVALDGDRLRATSCSLRRSSRATRPMCRSSRRRATRSTSILITHRFSAARWSCRRIRCRTASSAGAPTKIRTGYGASSSPMAARREFTTPLWPSSRMTRMVSRSGTIHPACANTASPVRLRERLSAAGVDQRRR